MGQADPGNAVPDAAGNGDDENRDQGAANRPIQLGAFFPVQLGIEKADEVADPCDWMTGEPEQKLRITQIGIQQQSQQKQDHRVHAGHTFRHAKAKHSPRMPMRGPRRQQKSPYFQRVFPY